MIISEVKITLIKQSIDQEQTPETKEIIFNRETYTWNCKEGLWPLDVKFVDLIADAIKFYNGKK